MTGLFPTSLEATNPGSSSSLIVSRDSFSHMTCARFQIGGAEPTRTFYYRSYVFVYSMFMTSGLALTVDTRVSLRRMINNFLNVRPFDYTEIAVVERSGAHKLVIHGNWMVVVTQLTIHHFYALALWFLFSSAHVRIIYPLTYWVSSILIFAINKKWIPDKYRTMRVHRVQWTQRIYRVM